MEVIDIVASTAADCRAFIPGLESRPLNENPILGLAKPRRRVKQAINVLH